MTYIVENAVLRPDPVFLEDRGHAHRIPHFFLHRFGYVALALVLFLGFGDFSLGQQHCPQNEQRRHPLLITKIFIKVTDKLLSVVNSGVLCHV